MVERDASVTDPCAEVVSPVCRYRGRPQGRLSRPNACDSDGCTLGDACVDEGESDIKMVQEVVRAIREAGARTDSSCGIHVHVGFGQHTPASLRRLVNMVNIGHHWGKPSAGYATSTQALIAASRGSSTRFTTLPHAKEDLLTMALGISQHRREEWCRPVDQRFLEALNRQKPDTLESFAAIWYRHNSEAGYYWEMLARHHYDHSR